MVIKTQRTLIEMVLDWKIDEVVACGGDEEDMRWSDSCR